MKRTTTDGTSRRKGPPIMTKKKKKIGARTKKERSIAVEALAALDAHYRQEREKYLLFVESVQKLSGLQKAEAWLSYVSDNIDDFGDQEALVFLQSRGKDCSKQIKSLISWWKECEKRAIAASIEPVSIHNLSTGKSKRYRVRTRTEVTKIEKISRFSLRDFWDGDRNQQLSIDATMLRTVEWCGIGGFNAWWKRYAKDETRNLTLGGADPLPMSFWLFNMCRSRYAISLMPKALSMALDALEMLSDDDQYPWTFRRGYDPPGAPAVDHTPFTSTIIFAHHVLRPGTEGKLVAPAIDSLQKHQFEDGGWPCWANENGKPDIESTAMAMHAIALQKPNGFERTLDAGREYLLVRQDRAGHWTEPSAPDPVYLTVLVLDAIEMAAGGSSLTFALPGAIGGPFGHGQAQSPARQGTRRFRVALSFPGELRAFVEPIAENLAQRLGKPKVLYDKYHQAEFARPNLDVYLQSLYHDDSDLLVVFLCADYEEKDWCRLEWRAIRDLIKRRRSDDVMLVRFDQTLIPGILSIDGYIDASGRSPDAISGLILERLQISD